MKFRNEFWLILFREYISPNLFAVLDESGEDEPVQDRPGADKGFEDDSGEDQCLEDEPGQDEDPKDKPGEDDGIQDEPRENEATLGPQHTKTQNFEDMQNKFNFIRGLQNLLAKAVKCVFFCIISNFNLRSPF